MGGDIKMRIKKAFLRGRGDSFDCNGKHVELRLSHRVAGHKFSLFVDGEFSMFVDTASTVIRVLG